MPKEPVLPDLVIDWVRVNPFPTLLATPSLVLIFQNRSFEAALASLDKSLEDLLTDCFGDAYRNLAGGAENCLVETVNLPGGRNFDLHLTRLPTVESDVLCCMLIPATQTSETLFLGLLESVDCPLALTDGEGTILYSNNLLNEWLGYGEASVTFPDHLRHIEFEFADDAYQLRLADANTGVYARVNSQFLHRDGSRLPVVLSTVTSQDGSGENYLLTIRKGSSLNSDGTEVRPSTTTNIKSPEQSSAIDTGDLQTAEAFPLGEILIRVEQVATTDLPVLIEGPPGTNKRRVAERIHRLSSRTDGPFIVVTCQDLPPEIIESELFGYPKGVLAGTYRDRQGRLADADNGTLFIEDVEQLTLPLQSRLVQVLEEGTFLATDEARESKTDVRLIVSANDNLRDLVKRNKFRADLLTRLTSFPIQLPPLGQRPSYIAELTKYFIKKFNLKFAKAITGVDDSTLNRLQGYSFPDNEKELEQMIERAFIVSGGGTLPLTVPEENVLDIPRPVLDVFDGRLTEFLSLEEYQRKYIQLVLESTNGKVSGKNGAAEILKVHPQTLFSKMKKLGIRR